LFFPSLAFFVFFSCSRGVHLGLLSALEEPVEARCMLVSDTDEAALLSNLRSCRADLRPPRSRRDTRFPVRHFVISISGVFLDL
jgi:hypothetical protein